MKLFKRISLMFFALTVLGMSQFADVNLQARKVTLMTVADARVGRPLTYFSVAGVARRTVRRCAVGVYHCY